MELNQGLRNTILEALSATMSPDFQQRKSAEEKLKVLEVTDEYAVHLAQISVDPQFHLSIRQLASIVLRQYTNHHWSTLSDTFSPPEPSEEAKNSIRQALVVGLKEPDTKVKNTIAYALANVAKWDWPDHWPDLFDIILAYLKSEDPDLVDGSMRVVIELADEITDRYIPSIGPIILPEIHRIFTNAEKYHVRTREMALDVFYTLYQVICQVSQTHQSLVTTLLEPVLLPFAQALVMALQVPDGPALDNGLRAKIFFVLTTIVLNSPEQASMLLQEVMPTVWTTLVNCAEIFVKSVLNSDGLEIFDGRAISEGGCGHNPVMAVFDFLSALIQAPKTRKFVKAAIQDVLYYLLIYMQMPNNEVEDFLENVDSYIVNEDDEKYMKSVRNRAHGVLVDACNEFRKVAPEALGHAIMRLCQEAAVYKSEGRPDWWKSLEVCMHSLSAVAAIYVGRQESGGVAPGFNPVAVVQSIFEDPSIRDASPFLLGECLNAAGKLADLLPEQFKNEVVKASVEAIHPSQHHVTKVCGIRALYSLHQNLKKNKQSEVFVAYVPTMIDSLISFANQYPEGEPLPLIIELFQMILSIDDKLTVALMPKVLPFLTDVYLKLINDSVVVLIVQEILVMLVKLPDVIGVVQQHVIPALVGAIRAANVRDKAETDREYATIFTMIKIIVRASAAPLSDVVMLPLPILLQMLMENENEEAVQEGGELLRAYIATSPTQFCSYRDSEGRSGLHYALEIVTNMLSPQGSDSSAIFVGRLVNTVIQRVGDQLGERKEILLRLVLSKLNRTENPFVKESLLTVFAYLVHTQFESLLDFLSTFPGPSGTSALEFVLSEWTMRQSSFISAFELKISTIALAKFLQHGVTTNDPRLVMIQVTGDEIIPEGTTIRTRLQRKNMQIQYTRIPLLVKIFKVLVHVMYSELYCDKTSEGYESEEESDSEQGEKEEHNGNSEVNLSDVLDEGDSESPDDDFENDPDAIQHPLYRVKLGAYLKELVTQVVAQPFFQSSFRHHISECERRTMNLLDIRV